MVTLEQKEAKRLTNLGFSRFRQVFQKDFNDMHGVKRIEMKLIIVKFAFKKKLLFPPLAVFPSGFFLCVIARLS